MAHAPLPSQAELNALLDYDPATGQLTWKARPGNAPFNARFAGKPALNANRPSGHLTGKINYRQVMAHRVIWKMVYGTEPDIIDHQNHNPSDNRLNNLRSTTTQGNAQNQRRAADNTSGVTGVVWCKQTSKWRAMIMSPAKKRLCLGRYDDFNLAVAARKAAERAHGFHVNHGR